MKNSLALLILISLFSHTNSFSQVVFKKRYTIKNKLDFYYWEYKKEKENSGISDDETELCCLKKIPDIKKKEDKTTKILNHWERKHEEKKLLKDNYVNVYDYLDGLSKNCESYKKLDATAQEKLNNIIERNQAELSNVRNAIKTVEDLIKQVKEGYKYSAELVDSEGKKFTVTSKEADLSKLKKILGYNVKMVPDFFKKNENFTYRGNVLFEKEKLYVNIWNFPKSTYKDDETDLYYTLRDGQTAKLNFKEFTTTALTIPFKYRPEHSGNVEVKSFFSTTFNAGLFMGATTGRTKFHYRKKVGNKTVEEKLSLGVFLGAASETLTANNVFNNALTDSKTQTIGLFSRGLGIIYSRDKISAGFFMGWDKGLGSLSSNWHYDNRLWLGIGVGYDIFKL
ncbi:hypothetical protein [Maribacter sp. 2210JD10-5]|uniref:hypothetical protein n=1 Tax=Maribacter sp. 2210JD10-5 TaxID=3386272 RepID=UPI0039BD8138